MVKVTMMEMGFRRKEVSTGKWIGKDNGHHHVDDGAKDGIVDGIVIGSPNLLVFKDDLVRTDRKSFWEQPYLPAGGRQRIADGHTQHIYQRIQANHDDQQHDQQDKQIE